MQETTFEKERERSLLGYTFVVGIDEAGRGPLAGPVVACAVALRNPSVAIALAGKQEFGSKVSKLENQEDEKMWKLVRDSKTLSEKQREKMFDFIHEHFYVGTGIVNAETIDRVNILQATFLAMKAAVSDLQKNIKEDLSNFVIPAKAGIQEDWNKAWIPGQARNDSKEDFLDKIYLLVDGDKVIPNCSYKQEAVIGGDGTVKSVAAASIIAKVTRDRMIVEYDKQYPGYGFAKHKGYGTRIHMDALRRLGPSPIHRMSFRPVLLSIPENVNKRFGNVLKPKRK